jgi:allophanate hydrolase
MTASGNPLSLDALASAYRDGADPVSVITAVYERIAAHADPALFIHLIPKAEAIAAATALLGRDRTILPLFGVPFVIKDNIDLAGVPTTAGCPSFAYVPNKSATVVEKLIAAGAIAIGKTNLDQFATGLVGVRSPYGVPRNPLDATIIPGGSSSGSACAVAAGLVPFSLGTDTAGSGRVPAAMTNIVGLKPTCGLVSTTGVVPAVRSLDCTSIFSGCVSDARAVLNIIAGFDENDAFSRLPQPTRPATSTLRVGIPTATDLTVCTPAIRSAFTKTCDHLRALGHSIIEINFAPFAESAKSLYGGAWVAERSAAVGDFIADHPNDCHPVVRDIILAGRSATGVAAHRDRYRLMELRRAAEATWSHMDVLLLPTVPDYPTVAEVLADPIARNSRLGTFTNFANLLDTAALTVPVGPLTNTLQASVTLFAPAWGDALIAELGAALHARAGVGIGKDRQAIIPTTNSQCSGSGISLAVVGAHLSGQPLNHQLVTLGARLEQTTATAPFYRLFHLPTTPAKPGLIRVTDGGASIEVEVWRLSETAFGRFVAAIPAPLGIGRLTLVDGREVSGFICEPHALSSCTDITAHGGWRAFRQATGI